jgi:hypothetical protein
MSESENSSHAEKLFYRPIEAAIRWCDLIAYESQILQSAWEYPERVISDFPQWPCLHAKLEKILEAIRNQELQYGTLGVTVAPGTPVDMRLLTVRHTDLKQWVVRYHSDQRPTFLFSRIAIVEETIHYSTYLILQADRDALSLQLNATKAKLQELESELAAAGLEREHLRSIAKKDHEVNDQSKASFLNVIGALVNTMLGSSKAGRKHSIFESQASIVDSITAHYAGVTGLSKRSLDEKFAAGRRSLAQAKR